MKMANRNAPKKTRIVRIDPLKPEKKLLEEMLERALGAQRRKPVPRAATAAGKTAARRAAPRKPRPAK